MTKPTKSQQPDRGAAIYRALRHAIIEQALAPGAKLPEDAIGEQFGASRTIVRNALARLAAEGLVELQRNRGASVAVPSWDEAQDTFQVRIAIEQLIMRRLAGRLSARQVAALMEHVTSEEEARGKDEALSIRLATEFHILLAEMTSSPVYARFAGELASRCGLILALYSRPHSSECAVSEHRQIIHALKANDTKRAVSVMTEHLEAVVHRALIKDRSKKDADIKSILSSYTDNTPPTKRASRKRGR